MPEEDLSIAGYFADLPDPRVARTKAHALTDILVVALCAVIAGADSWEEAERFGEAEEGWPRRFLALHDGIPSHDTDYCLFARRDLRKSGACVARWMVAGPEGCPGVLMASVGPGRKAYRRWSHHRGEAARFARFEMKERSTARQESARAAGRDAINSWLIKTRGFAGKSRREIRRAADRTIDYHKYNAAQALDAARQWELKRPDSETAALWCLDPCAPEAS